MTESIEPQGDVERKGLTAEILRSLVRYDKDEGVFYRLSSPTRASGKLLNKPATPYLNDNGYALISLGRVWRFRVHQLAWLYVTGRWPTSDVDHINGIRNDNRWANLRAATRAQNIQNSRIRVTNLSGVKGVSFDTPRGKWKAQIRVAGKQKLIGRFDTKEAAAEAYISWAKLHFGEFARAA